MTVPEITTQSESVEAGHETIHRAYELVLGREPESEQAFQDLLQRPLTFVLAAFFEGPEFADNVRRPVRRQTPPGGGFFDAPPRDGLLAWAARALPLTAESRARVSKATTWSGLYDVLFDDPVFTEATNLTGGRPWSDGERTALAALARTDDGSRRSGQIEEVDRGQVRGWAVDAAAPDRPMVVEFWVDEAFVAAITPTGFRRDVQDRFGGSGIAGFTCDLSGRARRGGGRLELRDATSRRVLASADLAQHTPTLAPHESVRSELAQVRRVLERLEAAVPALASLQGLGLADYAEYYETFYRPPVRRSGDERASAAVFAGAKAAVIANVGGASAGQVEDLVWSVVDQITPAATLSLHGVEALDPALLGDLCNRIDWSGRVGRPAAGWLSVQAGRAEALARVAADVVVMTGRPGVLAPDALYRLCEALERRGAAAAYGDEDRVAIDAPAEIAGHADPRFKTAFDLDLLRQTPFVGDCIAFRVDRLRPLADLPYFGSADGPAQAVLRLAEQGAGIDHAPRLIWSAFDLPQDDAADQPTWPEIVADVLKANPTVVVEPCSDDLEFRPPNAARIRHVLPAGVSATVIVPTRDRLDLLGPCVDSLLAAAPWNRTAMDLVIVDHESREPETLAWLDQIAQRDAVAVKPHQGPFNWALMNNLAAAESQADVLIFLNNDTLVLSRDWLDELVAQAMRPEVGVVGARLLYEDGTLQHGGLIARNRVEHYIGHEGVGLPGEDGGYLHRYGLVRRAAAVYGACMAVRRDVFQSLGGFDSTRLGVEGNDVDLCLKAQAAGLLVLYTPNATLYHLESKSRGFAHSGEALKISRAANQVVWDRWSAQGWGNDLYNPHFDREARPFTRLRPPTIGWPQAATPVEVEVEVEAEPEPGGVLRQWAARLGLMRPR